MKTCNIKGVVREFNTNFEFQTIVKDLMANQTIKPQEGVLVMGHFHQGHKIVSVDGTPLLEIAELPDGD